MEQRRRTLNFVRSDRASVELVGELRRQPSRILSLPLAVPVIAAAVLLQGVGALGDSSRPNGCWERIRRYSSLGTVSRVLCGSCAGATGSGVSASTRRFAGSRPSPSYAPRHRRPWRSRLAR